jgi:hypothetical protein
MVLGVISIGFLLMSMILLTRKKNMPPILKTMKQTGEYFVLMKYVSVAVRNMILLIAYASLGLFGIFIVTNMYLCVYALLAVSAFLEFRRVILMLFMITMENEKT